MLVVAALRWVDARALIDPMTGEVSRDPRASGAGEADRCALEHALLAAEALTARCLAVTAGPPAADGMLIDALAAGAHEVLRIDGPDPADTVADSGEITAQILADGILRGHPRPDLVVCGDHSADRGTGATPGYLAEHFAAAQSLGLVELAVRDGMLRALRRLDGGRRERLSVPLPAVCSVEPGAVRLRRATLPAMLAARRTQVPVVHVISSQGTVRVTGQRPYRPRPLPLPPPEGTEPHQRVLALTGAHAERTPPRVLTPDTPAQAADALLDYLGEHGYLQR